MKFFCAIYLLVGLALDGIAQPLTTISQEDSLFLRMVQRESFKFFWNEVNTSTGLIKDRSTTNSASSIASVGFGLSSICVATDYGWVTRAEAADRVRTTLSTFWNGPQGFAAQGTIGHKGFFYHFLSMNGALRDGNTELSSIDSALLLAGIIHCQQYFDGSSPDEQEIRALADSIYRRADFEWFRSFGTALNMGWLPETGWLNQWWIGYNEAMILYILALGSPTHTIDASLWDSWTSGYNFGTQYGYSYVVFPPLFGHQYSHCWIDFRGIRDTVMSRHGFDYFENSRRATLAQQAYCKANPLGYPAYSDSIWGITACDGPPGIGYKARGAPPAESDDGTLAPTAPGGSIPFAPHETIRALKTMYRQYCAGPETRLWGPYGFRDAFNLKYNWFDLDYIGIDQGPIVLMIENFFTQRVWNVFMKSPYIQAGLKKAGFKKVSTDVGETETLPEQSSLEQNYPNPFNPNTSFQFRVSSFQFVSIKVFDVLGREVAVLVNEERAPGVYKLTWDARLRSANFGGQASALPSGIYLYRMQAGSFAETRKMVLTR